MATLLQTRVVRNPRTSKPRGHRTPRAIQCPPVRVDTTWPTVWQS
jgi:hypothetical protein